MRILLADSQIKVRFALRVLLERQRGLEVVGEAATAQDLLEHQELHCADLVLLDWNLAGVVPARFLSALRAGGPNVGVIVLSGWPEARDAALAAGADGFVSKGNPPEDLLAAIAHCQRHGEPVTPGPSCCSQ